MSKQKMSLREKISDLVVDVQLLFKRSKKPIPADDQLETNPTPTPTFIQAPPKEFMWSPYDDNNIIVDSVGVKLIEPSRPTIPNLDEICMACGADDRRLWDDQLGLKICRKCVKTERKNGHFA
jgi:hypothetical protein